MAAYEDGREYDVNDSLVAGGVTYIVTAVSHQNDDEGNKHSFQYTIRNKDEADAEAAAERQAQIEAANASEADVDAAAEQQNQSDAAKENEVDVADKEAVDKAHAEFDGELSVNEPQPEKPGKGGAPAEDDEEKLPSLNAN